MKCEIVAALAATLLVTGAFAQMPKLATDETMVKSPDPGIEIYVRNKRPTDVTSFRPERTLLYVHGATYPASTAFDLPLDGQSWMDYIAARGYDVYLLDIRGYGKSSRPKEMSEAPTANPPIVRGDIAIQDIGTVVNFILSRRNIPRCPIHDLNELSLANIGHKQPWRDEPSRQSLNCIVQTES
jgi:hypothetical protein